VVNTLYNPPLPYKRSDIFFRFISNIAKFLVTSVGDFVMFRFPYRGAMLRKVPVRLCAALEQEAEQLEVPVITSEGTGITSGLHRIVEVLYPFLRERIFDKPFRKTPEEIYFCLKSAVGSFCSLRCDAYVKPEYLRQQEKKSLVRISSDYRMQGHIFLTFLTITVRLFYCYYFFNICGQKNEFFCRVYAFYFKKVRTGISFPFFYFYVIKEACTV